VSISSGPMTVIYEWRGAFENAEMNALHAEAFATRLFDEAEWNWVDQVARHSLGWVVAREESDLAGFANVLSDGFVHAWLQDVMVAAKIRRRGVGVELVRRSREEAANAGCDYLHVDFENDLKPFYYDACGFAPTNAGLIELR
jgi:GNAT superfamily N-acetyltransferase